MRKWSSTMGMSLVEASIILLVLATLSAVIAPSINDYVNDAKRIKVKEDLEALGVITARLMSDTGYPCLRKNARLSPLCAEVNHVNILYGRGEEIEHNQVCQIDFIYNELDRAQLWNTCSRYNNFQGNSNAYSSDFMKCVKANRNQLCVRKKINWDNDDYDHGDSMDNQFSLNTPGYLTPSQFLFMPPLGTPTGWRGSYVGAPVGADPWGNKYLINSQFLARSLNVDTCGLCSDDLKFNRSVDPHLNGGFFTCNLDWSYDTFSISAGPNGIYETPFALRGAVARGDDIIYVIQGDPR